MAKSTVYPYGTDGQLPSSIGLVNDLKTGGVDKALTAEQWKIIVAYGVGTTALPSGVLTYNTSGDVIAVYSIDAIATVEPECVAFDRDDWRLLLSDANKNVMQIYV